MFAISLPGGIGARRRAPLQNAALSQTGHRKSTFLMREFHYFPPTQDDQRAFVMQLLGAILGLLVVVFLFWHTRAFELRAVLFGAAIAILWMLGSAAWRLEKRARRSQLAKVGFDEQQLYVTDWHGVECKIPWAEISSCEIKSGKLWVAWKSGTLHVGARELEDGMEFIQHVAKKIHGDKSTFIPLTSIEPSQPSPKNIDSDNQ